MVIEDVLKESDLYKVLGINPETETSEINKIYKSLAKRYHPDVLSSSSPSEKERANQIFSKITSAYNILKDTDKRKNYDYERKLRQEYEKTLQSTTFTFSKPDGTGVSLNINNSNNQTQKKGAAASEETKNEQAEKLYNSAMDKYKAGNIDAAILDLQTAIVLSKTAKYHSCLGIFMNEKGWSAYAQSHFKTALNIDPKDKLALKYLNTPAPAEEKKEEKKVPEKKVSEKKGFFAQLKEFFSNLFSSKK